MTKPANFPGRKNLRREWALERYEAALKTLNPKTDADKIKALEQMIAVTRIALKPGANVVRTKKHRTGLGKMGR